MSNTLTIKILISSFLMLISEFENQLFNKVLFEFKSQFLSIFKILNYIWRQRYKNYFLFLILFFLNL